MRALFLVFTVVAATGCPAPKKAMVTAGVGCTQDSQCGELGYCDHGQCVACRDDADCGEGRCTQGRCEVEVVARETEEDVTLAGAGAGELCFGEPCTGRDHEGDEISGECRPQAGSDDLVALASVAFDFDLFDLTDTAQEILVANADCLAQVPELTVIIEGHADERGTSEYNLALGDERAAAVRRYLANLGIDESRLRIMSKGEEEPVCVDATEECWSRNRRVDLIQVRQTALTAN